MAFLFGFGVRSGASASSSPSTAALPEPPFEFAPFRGGRAKTAFRGVGVVVGIRRDARLIVGH